MRPPGALLLTAAVVLGGVLQAATAFAHALDPVLFELRERADGQVDVLWKAPNARVPGLDLRPNLPPECRTVGETRRHEEDDATIAKWTVDCGGSIVGKTVGVVGLESTDALLRVALASGSVDRRVLGASNPSIVIEGEPSSLDVLHDYGWLGTEHIAGGIDHLLFVFGLLLLVGGTRSLLATITAFTLGHSVTLALAALQVVSVPQAPVEVLIAITIYVLAVELARGPVEGTTILRRRPWAMAFSFGLLHGLGFAGALREAGLPEGDVPLALFAFNVGIEVGQVAFVAVIVATLLALKSVLERLPGWMHRIPVYAMGTMAAYWVFERAAQMF